MLELGAGADILRGLGWLYIGLIVVLVGVALWFPERWWQKVISVIVVLLIFIGPAHLRYREREKLADARKARYEKAKALFDELCKTAGENIYKTVDCVEGILLLNVRSRGVSASALSDPNWVDAGLPREPGQGGYITTFLLWEQFQDKRADRGYLNHSPSDRPGYRYVDVRDLNGLIYRYRLDHTDVRKLSREQLKGKPARYAVSIVNMTDPEARQLWVAGTTVQVTDTATNEGHR